ncbi:MAG TPA: Rieske (2Fe-2S) protein [Candidatus Aquilonibacter sp.]|nr:Rieske (2Fe-2S) protein [Candidatus Aquilonibacter sp.]
MPQFVRVGDRDAVAPGSGAAFSVGRFEVAVFNIDGSFYALENACPHQGGPIADGWIEEKTVTCPWHAWCFNLETGRMTLGDFASIPRFEVRVEGDGIFVATEPMAE